MIKELHYWTPSTLRNLSTHFFTGDCESRTTIIEANTKSPESGTCVESDLMAESAAVASGALTTLVGVTHTSTSATTTTTTAAIKSAAASSSATTATIETTATATTIHALLLSILACLAAHGLVLEALAGIELLLAGAENELLVAVSARKSLISISILVDLSLGLRLRLRLGGLLLLLGGLHLLLLLGLGIRRVRSGRRIRRRLNLLLLLVAGGLLLLTALHFGRSHCNYLYIFII